jgi:hypothetical protein
VCSWALTKNLLGQFVFFSRITQQSLEYPEGTSNFA